MDALFLEMEPLCKILVISGEMSMGKEADPGEYPGGLSANVDQGCPQTFSQWSVG